MRNISLLQRHYSETDGVPESMALGFSAFLLFMKCKKGNDGKYYGEANGISYLIEDENAAYFAEKWMLGEDKLAEDLLSNEKIWGVDLLGLKGFSPAIKENIKIIQEEGILAAINKRQFQKTTV